MQNIRHRNVLSPMRYDRTMTKKRRHTSSSRHVTAAQGRFIADASASFAAPILIINDGYRQMITQGGRRAIDVSDAIGVDSNHLQWGSFS